MSAQTMDAIVWRDAQTYGLEKVPIPEVGDNDILVKVACCGVCGTDGHIADLSPQYPIIPGHEVCGSVAKIGKDVKGFTIGERCMVDPVQACHDCFYCNRGQIFMGCENPAILGTTRNGGFAEYLLMPSKQIHKIHNLSNVEATLIEPCSTAIHAADRLECKVGSEVLVFGAGPSGLMLCQILRQSGAALVVLAANKGKKMDIAKENGYADEFIEFDRNDAEAGWNLIKEKYPYGFDGVVEATGSAQIAKRALYTVRTGGTLVLYSLYSPEDEIGWPPFHIFAHEITIRGTLGQTHCFPRAVRYLDSGKVKTNGIITDKFALKDYSKMLEKLKGREAVKIVVEVANT